MTSTMTADAFLCRVGTLSVFRSTDTTQYVLRTATGDTVGTYPTAQRAMNAGVAAIKAARNAR